MKLFDQIKIVFALLLIVYPISIFAQQQPEVCTNLLFGRWNLIQILPFEKGGDVPLLHGKDKGFVVFGSDGMCITGNGESASAIPWHFLFTNGQAAVASGEKVDFVRMDGSNRLHIVNGKSKLVDCIFERDSICISRSSATSAALIGTWKSSQPEDKGILRVFYREGVYVDDPGGWGFAGTWKVNKSLWKTSLILGDDSYSIVFDGTNKWHGTSRNSQHPYIEFERCASSNYWNN